jgi:S-adenosyl-L-methionine hydrolase (adenosine-forming)
MILLFTDFGHEGPYVGEMHMAIKDTAPAETVIDLMHDAPTHNPKAAAYLLAALSTRFPPESHCVAVVDPGVGGDRPPVIVRANSRWFVGPGNGLFEIICRRAADARQWPLDWRPPVLSRSFHGRDLFAPAAAQLATGCQPDESEARDWRANANRPGADWPDDLPEIIHIDRFGNAITGARPPKPSAAGSGRMKIGDHDIKNAGVFSDVSPGEQFWYENSMGLVEIAVNQGNAALEMGLQVGDTISCFAA